MYKFMDILNLIMACILMATKWIVRFAALFMLCVMLFQFTVAVVIFRILTAFAILYIVMQIITHVELYTEKGESEDGGTEEKYKE